MTGWGIEQMEALTEGYDDWFNWLDWQIGKGVTDFQPRSAFQSDADYQAQKPSFQPIGVLTYDAAAGGAKNTFWKAEKKRMSFSIEDTETGGRISGGRILGD